MFPIIVTAIVAWGLARHYYRPPTPKTETSPRTPWGLYRHHKGGWYWIFGEVVASDNDGLMLRQNVVIYFSLRKLTFHTRGGNEFHQEVEWHIDDLMGHTWVRYLPRFITFRRNLINKL
jgi:hypothetical protein